MTGRNSETLLPKCLLVIDLSLCVRNIFLYAVVVMAMSLLIKKSPRKLFEMLSTHTEDIQYNTENVQVSIHIQYLFYTYHILLSRDNLWNTMWKEVGNLHRLRIRALNNVWFVPWSCYFQFFTARCQLTVPYHREWVSASLQAFNANCWVTECQQHACKFWSFWESNLHQW